MLGQDLGKVLLDAELGGDGAGHGLAVAGDHGHVDIHLPEAIHGLPAFGTDQVGHAKSRDDLVILEQVDDSVDLVVCLLDKGVEAGRALDVEVFEQVGPADVERTAVVPGAHAAALEGLEIADAGGIDAALLGGATDAAGQGVLGVGLDGCGQGQCILLAPVLDRGHAGHAEFAFGQGAGLVKHDDVDLARLFEGQPVADEDAVLGAHGRGDGDDEGDGQAERVGTGGDEHGGDAGNDVDLEADGDHPGDRRDRGDADGDVKEPAGGPVGQHLGVGFALLGLAHHAHDAGQGGFVAGGGDAYAQAAVAVDGAADDLVAGRFIHGPGLAGDHGLVDARLAFLDLAIGGDAGAGTDEQQVTLVQLGDGYLLGLAVVADPLCGVGHELGELVECARGPAHAAHLDPVAEEHDVDQGDEFPEKAGADPDKEGGHAVAKGDEDGHRDEGHHAGLALAQLGDGHIEEGEPAVDKDDG